MVHNVIASNKEKIDQKIIQMNNERLIQAREIEARAAQERVEAEKDKAKREAKAKEKAEE